MSAVHVHQWSYSSGISWIVLARAVDERSFTNDTLSQIALSISLSSRSPLVLVLSLADCTLQTALSTLSETLMLALRYVQTLWFSPSRLRVPEVSLYWTMLYASICPSHAAAVPMTPSFARHPLLHMLSRHWIVLPLVVSDSSNL